MTPYLVLKAVHVAAVLIFVGGLFAQTFALAGGDGAGGRVRSWDRRVTTPAMVVLWLTGAAVAGQAGFFASPWLWAKLALVLALTGLHGIQSGRLRRPDRSEAAPAKAGVAPILIAAAVAAIALLVVIKPFQS